MIKMPWTNRTCPNVMLEITDACNVNCGFCYKKKGHNTKTLVQIEQELKTAIKLRNLHTVTISGGEPTLHPQLCQIIRLIKEYGFHVFLLTNGVLINEDYLRRLKTSGLDFIMFHVDSGQIRPDLPENPTFKHVKSRLKMLAKLTRSIGIDVSISATLYNDINQELKDYSQFFFNSEDITFMFLTRGVDPKHLFFKQTEECHQHPDAFDMPPNSNHIQHIINYYKRDFGIEPFAYIPTNNPKHYVWISYFVPVIFNKKGNMLFKIDSNITDSWLMEIPRILTGRYIHKTSQNGLMTLIRTFFNSITTLRFYSFVCFLFYLLSPFSRLRHKMVVYDNGPAIEDHGKLLHCQYCPSAVLKEHQLLACYSSESNGTLKKGFSS